MKLQYTQQEHELNKYKSAIAKLQFTKINDKEALRAVNDIIDDVKSKSSNEKSIDSLTIVTGDSASTIKQLQSKYSDIKAMLSAEKDMNKTLNNEIESLRESLQSKLDKKEKDMLEKALNAQRLQFEEEKKQTLSSLQNRVDKVIQLEIELDDSKEKYRSLESAISEGDRALKRKVLSLERNIEQLTLMYHQLVSQKSSLKVECQVNEKRIQRKNERINSLEKQLAQTREQVQAFKSQVESLKQIL